MNLYNKYRPKDFDEMSGDSTIINNLQTIISKKNRPHTYLFTGPAGCGKTTAALICANKYIENSQIIEINSANNRGIDTARDIIETIRGRPLAGDSWVYIIDEVHKTTTEYQNAVLKILENPPEYVYFFLCTTNPEKLIKALKSRCTIIQFNIIKKEKLYRLVRKISRREDKEIEKEVLEEITYQCEGSARNALVLLEKILDIENKADALKIVSQGIDETPPEIKELCKQLIGREPSWKKIAEILTAVENKDVESIRYMILGYMSKAVLKSGNRKAAIIMESFLDPFYDSKKPGLVYACFQAINS